MENVTLEISQEDYEYLKENIELLGIGSFAYTAAKILASAIERRERGI